jgi:DNA (cytosine-5)-methyltransferase 1
MSSLGKRKKLSVVELFCGAGGTSFGFSSAGFDVRLGLDIDPRAVATFKKNHPLAMTLCDSVENVSGRQLLEAARIGDVDILIGGPSCQGYSTIGPRIEDDPRNFLFTHYLRLVSELRPRWILFENVKGMKFHGGGKFFKQLCKKLTQVGYRTAHAVLNAADYGVPQRRERLFVIGTLDNCDPTLPPPYHQDPRCILCSRPDKSNRLPGRPFPRNGLFQGLPCPRCDGSGLEPAECRSGPAWISVQEAIGDLPVLGEDGGAESFVPYSISPSSAYQRLMRIGATGYTHHKARPVSKYARLLIGMIGEGKGIRSVPTEKLPDSFKIMRKISTGTLRQDCTTLYHRLCRELPSYTITCSFTNVASGAFAHPLADRAITIREAARLQSFPDRFEFVPPGLKDQIGNAVPPLLAEAIAKHILLQMDRKRSKPEQPMANVSEGQRTSIQQPQAVDCQGSLELS